MTTANAHALFLGGNLEPSYHQAILLPFEKRRKLVEADKQIRNTLREAAKNTVMRGDTIQLATNKYRYQDSTPPTLEFRFLRQGSIAYDTATHPAHLPPQQNDLDDGIYVRTSFLSENDPSLSSVKLFEMVENALQDLCKLNGWTIKEKDTCVRVELNNFMHIDLPIYAIPDDQFSLLEKRIIHSLGVYELHNNLSIERLMRSDGNLRLPSDKILLAHRRDGWIASDPRKLQDWFEEQCRRYGPQLRRQCRYLKGWRDFIFTNGGPSSVLLLVCAVNFYKLKGEAINDNRDDIAFMHLTQSLEEMFQEDIYNCIPSAQVGQLVPDC